MCHLCGKYCIPATKRSPIPVRVQFGDSWRLVCWSCYCLIHDIPEKPSGETQKRKREKPKGAATPKGVKGSSPLVLLTKRVAHDTMGIANGREGAKMEATKRQHWAIFCGTGYDSRPTALTKAEASEIIGLSKNGGKAAAIAKLEGLGAIKKQEHKAKVRVDRLADLHKRAVEAGQNAAVECVPVPMVVEQHSNVLDDNSPVVEQYHVPGGVCGMAFAEFDGRSAYAKWLLKSKNGYKGSGGVVSRAHFKANGPITQSYEKQCAFVDAYCKVLQDAGVNYKRKYKHVD